ncbi:MAG: glycoside hydrolase family 3 protein [Faecalibacterium sp.]
MKKLVSLLTLFVLTCGLGLAACAKSAAEAEPSVQEIVAGMTLRQKIGQLFIVRPDALDFTQTQEQIDDAKEKGVLELTEEMRTALEAYPVGGVALFGKNIETPEQLRQFTAQLKTAEQIPLFLAVDEEGGRVARLANSDGFDLPKYASAFETEDAGEMGRTIGAYLKEYGFNMDFAPVADVNSNPDNPVIGKRAFSDDAQTVRQKAAAMAEGLQEYGIMPVYKHFPGHGDTAEDSHAELAVVHKTLEQLQQIEWVPYKDQKIPAVMVAHVAAPEAGVDGPASLSYTAITEWLRGLLGHEGLVITDSLSMSAITNTYSPSEACIRAIEAGADILLMPCGLREAMDGVENAVKSGRISESRIDESVCRILTAKQAMGLLDDIT